MTEINVEPGQTWEDLDPRSKGRTIRVDDVVFDSFRGVHLAKCQVLTNADNHEPGHTSVGRKTCIATNRMTGSKPAYRLLKQEQ